MFPPCNIQLLKKQCFLPFPPIIIAAGPDSSLKSAQKAMFLTIFLNNHCCRTFPPIKLSLYKPERTFYNVEYK